MLNSASFVSIHRMCFRVELFVVALCSSNLVIGISS